MSVIVKFIIKNYYKVSEDDRLDLDIAASTLYKQDLLTKKEQQILDLFKEQYTPKEVAQMLDIHLATLYRSFNSLVEKLSCAMGMDDAQVISLVEEKLKREVTEEEKKFCEYVITRSGYRINRQINIFNFVFGSDGKVKLDDDEDTVNR